MEARAEEGQVCAERGRPSPAASCWSWRKSSTSALTCVALGAWRWPRGCSWRTARSRSGSRTAGWGTRRSRNMERCRTCPSTPSVTRPPAAAPAPAPTTWGSREEEDVLSEPHLLPTCTSWIMLLCPPPSLPHPVTTAVVSTLSLQTSAVCIHQVLVLHRPPAWAQIVSNMRVFPTGPRAWWGLTFLCSSKSQLSLHCVWAFKEWMVSN